MNRRGTSAELEGVASDVTMDPWHDFDIDVGPDSQNLMRGANPLKDGMSFGGSVLMGDDVGAFTPRAPTDQRWRPGQATGWPDVIGDWRIERRVRMGRPQWRYVPVSPGAAQSAKQQRKARKGKRRRPTWAELQLAAMRAAQRAQQGLPPEEEGQEESDEEGESQDSPPTPPPLGGDGIAQSFAQQPTAPPSGVYADAWGRMGNPGVPGWGVPPEESVEGILGDASPFSYGTSSALQGYQRPSPPPQYGAPPPQYGAPPPQYGAPPPQYPPQQFGVPQQFGAPQQFGVKGEVGYWTTLTDTGTPIRTPEWTEIGTLGEAIERIRAAARDFRALPVLGTGAGTAGTNEFRTLVYQGITSGRYNRQRGWDLVRQYGEKWGRALSALVFIDEVDDDERLINEASNEVRDRVNDCRNLVRAATSR